MSEDAKTQSGGNNPSREDRLAAKLRENLRRRKAQSRQLAQGGDSETKTESPDNRLPKGDDES